MPRRRPHSELLFNAVLKYNTAPSGQTSAFQNHESTAVDTATVAAAAHPPRTHAERRY